MSERVMHTVRPVGFAFRKDERKYHVIGHIQDMEKDMFVYVVRYFGKCEQWWHYEAITAEEYDIEMDLNLIKELK